MISPEVNKETLKQIVEETRNDQQFLTRSFENIKEGSFLGRVVTAFIERASAKMRRVIHLFKHHEWINNGKAVARLEQRLSRLEPISNYDREIIQNLKNLRQTTDHMKQCGVNATIVNSVVDPFLSRTYRCINRQEEVAEQVVVEQDAAQEAVRRIGKEAAEEAANIAAERAVRRTTVKKVAEEAAKEAARRTEAREAAVEKSVCPVQDTTESANNSGILSTFWNRMRETVNEYIFKSS